VKRPIPNLEFWHRISYRTKAMSLVDSQDPKDVTRDITRDLSELGGEIAVLKGDASHWRTGQEYAALRHRLEGAHAAAEAALVEARRRVRLDGERER
jgi:hypothetical protein